MRGIRQGGEVSHLTGIARAALSCAAFVPPLIILHLIHKYGVNVPFWDEWDTSVAVLQVLTGQARSLVGLAGFHVEHRILFVQLATLVLAKLTHYNFKAPMYLGWLFQMVELLLIRVLIRNTLRPAPWFVATGLAGLASGLLFSLTQSEVWTWGLASLQWGISCLSVVGLVAVMSALGGKWSGLAAAASIATVGSFTSITGLLLWPIGLLAVVFYTRPNTARVRRFQALAWLVVGAAEILVYFSGWFSWIQFERPGLLSSVQRPDQILQFVVTYLGASVVNWGDAKLAAATGAFFLLVASLLTARMIVRDREGVTKMLPWLLIMLTCALAAGATAFGRLQFGVLQALAPRYAAVSVLFVIGLCVLAVHTARSTTWWRLGPRRPIAVGVLLVIVCVGLYAYSKTNLAGYGYIQQHHAQLIQARKYLQDVATAPDTELQLLYPDAATVRKRALVLEELGLGPFRREP